MKRYTMFVELMVYALGFLLVGQSEVAAGAHPDSLQSSIEKQKEYDIGVFPVIFYSDETRLAGGAAAQVVYGGQSRRYSSSIGMIGFYTQNKQYNIGVAPDIYWEEGVYKFSGQMAYSYFPDTFYGIGNNTRKEDEEDYTSRFFRINPSLQKRIGPYLYIGIQYDFAHVKLTEVEEGKRLDSGTLSGSEGGGVSGMGIDVTWDSRDNNLYPTRGSYHQFSIASYGSVLGSDFTYDSYLLDVRHYRPVFGEHIFALQGVMGVHTGKPPFQMLNQLGLFLRGYTLSRFMDMSLVVLQAEYRLRLFWRLGLVGFAGCGQVARAFEKISLKALKPSAGLGIRFALIPEQSLNLRIDLGIGKDDSSFDINISEAF